MNTPTPLTPPPARHAARWMGLGIGVLVVLVDLVPLAQRVLTVCSQPSLHLVVVVVAVLLLTVLLVALVVVHLVVVMVRHDWEVLR